MGRLLGEESSVRMSRGMDYLREEIIPKEVTDTFNQHVRAPGLSLVTIMPESNATAQTKSMLIFRLYGKNTDVWLDQSFQRNISVRSNTEMKFQIRIRLLAARGFTGLWLIGLWTQPRFTAHQTTHGGQGRTNSLRRIRFTL